MPGLGPGERAIRRRFESYHPDKILYNHWRFGREVDCTGLGQTKNRALSKETSIVNAG